jgi:hypothetical protein
MMPDRSQLEPATAALPASIIARLGRLAPKIDELLDNPDYSELRDAYADAVAIFVGAELTRSRQTRRSEPCLPQH